MDATLTQLLAGLFQAHQTIDQLQVELVKRDQRIAELEAVQRSGNGLATPAEVADAAHP